MAEILRKLIEEYLASAKLMQLATSNNNQPWVCTLWYVHDKDLNLYWFSSTNRRHSKELKNNKVAGVIVLPHQPTDPLRGLQFEGDAQELTKESEITQARSYYQKKIFNAETIDNLIANPGKPHKFYRLRPSKFVLFDVVSFPENARQEYLVR
jgi:uncharacterized protein YhbP (UPF0306 family)